MAMTKEAIDNQERLTRVQEAQSGLFMLRHELRVKTLRGLLAAFEQTMEAVPNFQGVHLAPGHDGTSSPNMRAKVLIDMMMFDASVVYNGRNIDIAPNDMDIATLACVLLVEGGWSLLTEHECHELQLTRFELKVENVERFRQLANNGYLN